MTTWHASDEALRSWVEGTAGPLASASVEQHIARCEMCQTSVASMVPAESIAAWDPILEAVERPRPSLLVRMLERLGLPPADTVVVAAAPVLRTAWVAGLFAVLAFVLLAGVAGGGSVLALFLAVAPLVPVAGVAAAYGPSADPAYEAVLASPYPMIRLVLLRTATVLATALPLTLVAGLILPISVGAAVAWLLPAGGLTVGVLTASAWVDPERAAVVLGVGWIVAVAWATRAADPQILLESTAMLGYAFMAFACLTILTRRLLAAAPPWRLL